MSSRERFEPVIGLEVHVQLATRTKLFCDCANEFGAPPNSLSCPICSGHPGVLPVPNDQAIQLALRAALMLGCAIQARSKFDRKHYFYPDLPKGYQITQLDLPFARGGSVELASGRLARLERIHLEEDAGKNTHAEGYSVVDLNRAGVPLIEIVGLPDLRSPAEAADFLQSLRRAMRYAGASDCDMEKGSLRSDANISVRETGTTGLGTKVEIKNLNSFRMVERALAHELERQAQTLERGEAVVQETRLWDDEQGETRSMRSKEEAMDYRYFPEPDIPPLRHVSSEVREIQRELPEPPWRLRRRFIQELGLGDHDAGVLASELDIARYFEATFAALGNAKLAANWVMTEVLRAVNETGVALPCFPVQPAGLAELIALVEAGKASRQSARKVFQCMFETGESAAPALEQLGLAQISDPAVLEPLIRKVIEDSPKTVQDYRKGKTKALDALKGKVMRETRGRADPALVGEILARVLGEA
ncbi:MAG: Asp-tRNA(Asn)/Glu-tRNA(Gln) amidotransferase subunit GatB [Planctomycetota bacterium]